MDFVKVILCIIGLLVGIFIMQGFDFVVAKIKGAIKHEKR